MAPKKKKNLNRCTKKLLGFIQSQYLPFINVIQMIIDNWRKEINFYYNDIANWFFFG